jgi:hypothetical protein
MKKIMSMVQQDPFLSLGKCHENCITIYPKTMASTRAAYKIRKIKKEILEGEMTGIIIKNGFQRYNLYSLTICIKDPSGYKTLIDLI